MKKKRFISVVMALAMVFAMCLSAISSVSAIDVTGGSDQIHNTFRVPVGVSTPQVEFQYVLTPTNGGPEISLPPISYDQNSQPSYTNEQENLNVFTQSIENFLEGIDFTQPGDYEYTLTETISNIEDGAIVPNNADGYTVMITVEYDQSGTTLVVTGIEFYPMGSTDSQSTAEFLSTYTTYTSTTLTKNLNMNAEATTPEAKFSFAFQALGTLGSDYSLDETASIPNLNDSIEPVTVDFVLGGAKTEKTNEFLKAENVDKEEETLFSHAGIYVYKVTENANTNPTIDSATNEHESIEYSTDSYIMLVVVKNVVDANGNITGQRISNVHYYTTLDDLGTAQEKKVEPVFNNIYRKDIGNCDDSALEIQKLVSGSLADTTQDFSFTLTLTAPQYYNEYTMYYYILYADGTSSGTVDREITFGTPITFTLKHGDTLKIDKLPVGTTYTLEEAVVNGYEPGVVAKYTYKNPEYDQTVSGSEEYLTKQLISKGTSQINTNVQGTNPEITYHELVTDSDDNTIYDINTIDVNVTNTLDNITLTGVLVDNLPFIMLILVAVGGFIAYIAIRRRRMSY